MSDSGGDNTESLRGYSHQGEVETVQDAQNILGLSPPISDDDADKAYRELTKEWHPDIGGNTEIFKAIDKAHDILIGERAPDRASGMARGQTVNPEDTDNQRTPGASGPTGATGGGFGYSGSESTQSFKRLIDIVETTIQDSRDKNAEIDGLINQYGSREVAKVIAGLIVNGAMDLGDVDKFVGSGSTGPKGRGGDERFGRPGRGGDERFGRY